MDFEGQRILLIGLIVLGVVLLVGVRAIRFFRAEGLIPFLWLAAIGFAGAGVIVLLIGNGTTGAVLLVGGIVSLIGGGVLEFLRRIAEKK